METAETLLSITECFLPWVLLIALSVTAVEMVRIMKAGKGH